MPTFNDNGECVGCSCETYRRSEQCKRNHPHLHLAEGERCTSPGKCPRVKWREKSTRSEMQIRKWAEAWPDCNWGIDCGKSGLVVFDLDIGKPEFDGGDLLDLLDNFPTWKVVTGSGGYHYIYRMPEGKAYSNSAGVLPTGCDVRANGGYVVAPLSHHKSGRRYEFAYNYDPKSIALAELPEPLQILLEANEKRASERRAEFHTWRASATLERGAELLRRLKPFRADDYASWVQVGMALRCEYGDGGLPLWDAWSAQSAKWKSGECARKWQTFNGSGLTLGTLVYLADIDDPQPDPTGGGFRRWLGATRDFVKTTSFDGFVPVDMHAGFRADLPPEMWTLQYRTDATDTKVADALLDMAEQHGRRTFTLRLDDLRRLAGVGSKATASYALLRLAGWFCVVDEAGADGTVITIVYEPVHVVIRLNDSTIWQGDDEEKGISFNLITTTNDGETPTDLPDYTRDKSLGPYLSGVTKAIRDELRAAGLTPTQAVERGERLRGLGEAVLRVADSLAQHGAMTRRELAAATGKAGSAIATATRRMETLGLVTFWRAGPLEPKVYRLVEDYTDQVKAMYPKMLTYKLDLERVRRDIENRLLWLERQMRGASPATVKKITLRMGRERAMLRDVIEVLHEDWSEAERLTWANTPSSDPGRRFVMGERAERNEPESDESILGNLAHYRRKAYAMAA